MAVPGYEDADWKAQSKNEGTSTQVIVFTAEDDIKTAPGIVKTGQNLAVFTLVMFDADNKLVPWDGAATNVPVVLATAINTTSPAGDRHAEYYHGACFNPDVLVWPAALDTYAERAAALVKAGASIRVKRVL